jgi:2-amino-4-hydroxy-6-hydroxymethyldihydropteridine diphosphokinase
MNKVYLSLGSNEGNRQQWLERAIEAVELQCGKIMKRSAVYETAAWGIEDQPGFLNMVLEVSTTLTPPELLAAIQIIETELGRQRTVKWGQRTLDIDILLFNEEIIHDDYLSIPHPYMHERRFTLQPLSEIAPDLVHPVLKRTIDALLKDCPDPLEARKA